MFGHRATTPATTRELLHDDSDVGNALVSHNYPENEQSCMACVRLQVRVGVRIKERIRDTG